MSISFAKFTKVVGAVLILTFSASSYAGDVYGKVGYGHYPFNIVIGYKDHGHHYGHKPRYYKHHNKHHYYKPKRYYRHHYSKHAYSHGYSHSRHYYNKPRRYCRSGY